MIATMKTLTASAIALLLCGAASALAAQDLSAVIRRLQQEKPEFARRHQALLGERYDLADRAAPGVTMSRGKSVQ